MGHGHVHVGGRAHQRASHAALERFEITSAAVAATARLGVALHSGGPISAPGRVEEGASTGLGYRTRLLLTGAHTGGNASKLCPHR